jgi:serine/threonine-protein kinase
MAGREPENLKSIKRYEIIRPIGEGGMGRVYLAMDRIIRRPVAVKVFRLDEIDGSPSGKKKALRDFFLETQTVGALLHPNIVVIHDVGKKEKLLYMIMEFVYGRTLLDMHRSVNLSAKRIVGIVYELALALDYAHSKEVVHRDIKPENIIMSYQGTPKITDFGIARFRKHLKSRSESIVGSARFMAPEQILRREQDHRVDIYQLGVVMYELLTRQNPFKGENSEETLSRICKDTPAGPDRFNNEVSQELSQLVLQCLEKSVSKRVGTARDLAERLAELLKGGIHRSVTRTDDLEERLKKLDMFARFSKNEIEELIKAARFIGCDPGKPIITETDSESTFYILLEGNVKVVKRSQIITDFLPGACFGAIGAFARQKRSAVVMAVDHCKLLEINALLFNELSEGVRLKILNAVVKDMASLIISLDDQIMNLTQQDRASRSLPRVCPICGYDNKGPIEVCPRCHTIATRRQASMREIHHGRSATGNVADQDHIPETAETTGTMDLSFWSAAPERGEIDTDDFDEPTYNIDLVSATDLQAAFMEDDVELDDTE